MSPRASDSGPRDQLKSTDMLTRCRSKLGVGRIVVQSALKAPIKVLPFASAAAGGAGNIQVRVTRMTIDLAIRWHARVQPLVDANYRPGSTTSPGQRTRADVRWDWRLIFMLSQLYSAASWAQPRSGPALALAMVVDTGTTGWFPIGMLTTVPRLFTDALGSKRDRGFGWYLADAPSEVYTGILKCPRVRDVAAALLDCGVQANTDRGHDGTFLLHADPKGGDRLQDFYRSRCGMTQLPANGPAVTPVFRRGPTDEYFHFDAAQARAFCQQFDPRR